MSEEHAGAASTPSSVGMAGTSQWWLRKWLRSLDNTADGLRATEAEEHTNQLRRELDILQNSTNNKIKSLSGDLNKARDSAATHAERERELHSDIEALVKQTEDLKNAFLDLQDDDQDLRKDLENGNQTLKTAQAETHQLKKALQNERQENESLREQVASFRTQISATSHMDNQLSDDAIRTKFDQIFYGIQHFAVKTFKGIKFEYDYLPDDVKSAVLPFIPNPQSLPKPFWISIATSIITQVMLQWFGDSHFGRSSDPRLEAATHLALEAFVPNAPETKKWLVATRKLFAADESEMLQQADQQLVRCMVDHAHHALRGAMNVQWRPDSEAQLAKVFAAAQELHRLLTAQQAVYWMGMRPAMLQTGAETFQPSW